MRSFSLKHVSALTEVRMSSFQQGPRLCLTRSRERWPASWSSVFIALVFAYAVPSA